MIMGNGKLIKENEKEEVLALGFDICLEIL